MKIKKSQITYKTYRPELPENWHVLEQLENIYYSTITWYREGKIHHNDIQRRICITFYELNPEKDNTYKYQVRGGRHTRNSKHVNDETLHSFNLLSDAELYINELCNGTDSYLSYINSDKYIIEYEKIIQKKLKEQKNEIFSIFQ